MDVLLWVLQGLAALVFCASGAMKVFLFEKVSHDVPSFGALPRSVWTLLGLVELTCVVGLVVPSLLVWHPRLSVMAACILSLETLLFIAVHVRYRERAAIVMSAILGILMAFVAYGREFVAPIT